MSTRIMLAMLAVLCINWSYPVRADMEVDSKRTAVIDGIIARGNLEPIGDQMLKWADKSTDDITLIINSPGGEVLTGFFFINTLEEVKSRGINVRCIVPNMAASMAFQILVHCSERHALSRSMLLWHRVRTFLGFRPVTAPAAAALAADLQRLDDVILRELNAAMPDSAKYVEENFENETLHVGENLHMAQPEFITTHYNIRGLYDVLRNEKVLRSQQPGMFDQFFRTGEIVYISPYVDVTLDSTEWE